MNDQTGANNVNMHQRGASLNIHELYQHYHQKPPKMTQTTRHTMVANSPQGVPTGGPQAQVQVVQSPAQVMVPVVAASGPPGPPPNQTMPVSPNMVGEPPMGGVSTQPQ